MNSDSKCPKCSGPMEIGFLRDRLGGASVATQWIAGHPEQSAMGGVKVREKPRYEVNVFRCTQCGYLEHYANVELPPAGLFSND